MIIKSHFKIEFDFEDEIEDPELNVKHYLMGYFQSDPEDMLRRAEKIQVKITLEGEQEIKKEVKLRLDV